MLRLLYLPLLLLLWAFAWPALALAAVLHAAAHSVTARVMGIPVEPSIGWGPTLFQRGRWRLRALPGAWVEAPLDELPWRRLLPYLGAGPLGSVCLGASILYGTLFVSFLVGVEREVPRVPPAEVGEVLMGSPADDAGLRPGDRILRLGGTPVDDWSDVLEAPLAEETVLIEVERDGASVSVEVHPQLQPGGHALIGIRAPVVAPRVEGVHAGPLEAAALAATESQRVVTVQLATLATLGSSRLGGPVQVAAPTPRLRHHIPISFAMATAAGCWLIALWNLLPLPFSDLLALIDQGLHRRLGWRVPERAMAVVVGLGLAGLFALVVAMDLLRILAR